MYMYFHNPSMPFLALQSAAPATGGWVARLSPTLLRVGPAGLLLWQWAALPLVAAAAAVLGRLLGRIACGLLGRLTRRTASQLDDLVLDRLIGPITVACAVAVAAVLMPLLELGPRPMGLAQKVVQIAMLFAIFWALWRLVDVGRDVFAGTRWARNTSASRTLLPLGARVSKVAVAAFAVVAMLSLLGYPVASLIAGLGIGGLAVALAAQKTVENLFGAFSIGVDRPFCEGDFVKVDDFVGTVESIGLRSTRFRTLDRTVITLPNGRLADMRLESFSARDRLRLSMVIGLVYETTAAQMRAILAELETVLRAHPKIWGENVVVRFSGFGASSLDVTVMAWFQTSDWGEFQEIRQDVLLRFMDVVEGAGSSFAFPTSTIHLASAPPILAGASNGRDSGANAMDRSTEGRSTQ